MDFPRRRRPLQENYEVVIVGGGIVGIGLFRDLSLHQVPCLLLDRGDFSSQTSQSSSKMLHGGIRYLEQGEFLLVKEALHEKNLWLRLAPHLCQELPFYLPVFKESKYPKWMTALGLFFYDFLSGFQNSPHRLLNKRETLGKIPFLREKNLRGSGVYYDAIMDDAKLALECLYDGLLQKGSSAYNYMELKEYVHQGSRSRLTLYDHLEKREWHVSAKEVIFATGPFTDNILKNFPSLKLEGKLLPSKGSHLWIEREALPLDFPVVLQTNDGRVVFVIPQKEAVLVGTTEIPVSEEIFNIRIGQSEIDYLLKNLNEFFTGREIGRQHILSTFAGVRPLVKSDGKSLSLTAREHQIFNPYSNVHIIVGGKYTTFRTMGQSISRTLVERRGGQYNPDRTKSPLRKPSVIRPFEPFSLSPEQIEKILIEELPRTFEDLVKRRLGVPARRHWKLAVGFEEFFLPLLPLLHRYLGTTEKEIRDYP